MDEFDKLHVIQYQYAKSLNMLGIERNFINLIRDIYDIPTGNIILNYVKLNAFFL